MVSEKTDAKAVILYHRAYRKLPGSFWMFFLQFLLFATPVSICSVLFYPEITRALCQTALYVLTPQFPADSLRMAEQQFLPFLDNYSYLQLPSTMPSFYFSLVNAVICVILLLILPRIETAKPIMIFLMMASSVHLVSSLFFLIAPQWFPYDTSEYSRLYILQQISICFFVPLIIGMAVMPLPSSILSRCLVVWSTYVYSLIFGTLRYIVFLYVLEGYSLLYMAILYFVTGPLIDFIYIVGIYSVYVARVANKMKGDLKLWQWQYSH